MSAKNRFAAAAFVGMICALALAWPAVAATIYVDDDAPGDPGPGNPAVSDPLEDGSAAHPFDAIQQAINAAVAADTVLVADGTYTGTGNKDLDFHGKAITVRSASGDPALCIIDCQGGGRGFYFHTNEKATSTVSGFTIRNAGDDAVYCESASPTLTNCAITGNAGKGVHCYNSPSGTQAAAPKLTNCTISGNGDTGVSFGYSYPSSGTAQLSSCTISGNAGGGVNCWYASPTLTDCTISYNTMVATSNPTGAGAGVYCASSSPRFTNCAIIRNTVSSSQYVRGGGMVCFSYSSPTLTNCTISGNVATSPSSSAWGGGIYTSDSSPILENCTISGNSAVSVSSSAAGGGLYCSGTNSHPTLTNCTITGNACSSASSACGAALYSYSSGATLTNCTVSGNSATTAGGAVYTMPGGAEKVTNSILWANTPREIDTYSGAVPPTVTNCDVHGGYAGTGNIGADPQFAFPNDFHLLGGSPCIDAGTNTPPGGLPAQDPDGNARPLDGNADGQALADIGTYEFNPSLPTIALNATSVEFHALAGQTDPQSQTLLIRNGGGTTLHWTLTWDALWLQADAIQGESTGEVDTVVLTPDVSSLSHGVYSTSVTVSDPQAPNSPRLVQVVLYLTNTLAVPGDYPTIQAAIDAAVVPGDEVLIAAGVYSGPGNHDLDFHGKALTVRSASGNPATCIIDCQGAARAFYFHSAETAASVVADLTIRNAYATDSSIGGAKGGAVYCSASSPTLTNCVIASSTAYSATSSASAGGIYCTDSAQPALSDCTISGNSAVAVTSGALGAGVCAKSASLALNNCTISGNTASTTSSSYDSEGGGIYSSGSTATLTLTGCALTGNTAKLGAGLYCKNYATTLSRCDVTGNTASAGGGIYSYNVGVTLCDCTISRNTAGFGAGIYWDYYSNATVTNCVINGNVGFSSQYVYGVGIYCFLSSPTVTNCTITGNKALPTGWTPYGVGLYCSSSSPKLTNSILWNDVTPNNTPREIDVNGGTPAVTYCDVQGGYTGTGNINADPQFSFPGAFRLMLGSPCIDAGTNAPTGGLPTQDADGSPRPLDGNGDGLAVADMGAFESSSMQPTIAIDKAQVELLAQEGHGSLVPQTLSVRNAGAGTLRWTLLWDAPWLQADSTQAESTGDVDTVALTADARALAHGTYLTYMTVSDMEASNGPRSVKVVLHVTTTLHIPGDYATIQAGIDASLPGDEVVVADGVYTGAGNKDLDFRGKPITVRSASGDPATCVIDCQGSGRAFYFHSGETAVSVVAGFTIRNGAVTSSSPGSWYGGGVYCTSFSSPTLAYCTISKSSATCGGGVACNSFSNPTLTHSTMTGNSTSYYGGATYCLSSSPILSNCAITGNTAASSGGGVYSTGYSTPKLTNCILWADTPKEIYVSSSSSTPVVTYSDIQGGYTGTGNANANPLFVNAAGPDGVYGTADDNVHLLPTSPCIDAGDPTSDFSLEPEPDGGRINMGAYGNTPEAETKGWIYIDAYHIARKTRVGRTLFEYDLTTTVRNASSQGVTNLVATLLAAPANVQVIDAIVNVGSVLAGSTVESVDTFTIRVDRTTLVSPLPISWRVTYGVGIVADFTTLLDLGPPRAPGDVNCDGRVDFDDINPFVLALTGAEGYYGEYPECDWLNADCNQDGSVDFDDINPFVELLTR